MSHTRFTHMKFYIFTLLVHPKLSVAESFRKTRLKKEMQTLYTLNDKTVLCEYVGIFMRTYYIHIHIKVHEKKGKRIIK